MTIVQRLAKLPEPLATRITRRNFNSWRRLATGVEKINDLRIKVIHGISTSSYLYVFVVAQIKTL